MTTSKNKSYAIWTAAGAIALVALIVGLASNTNTNTSTNTNTTNTTTITTLQQAPRLDVVFAVDATGSMGDEIDVVKREVWNIANSLMKGKPAPDIRFGLVFYQDRGDTFLVQKTDLTRNVDDIHDKLMAVRADGGGDWREHVGRGLHEAVNLEWDDSEGVTRLIYLVGDAPGHDDYNDGYDIESALRNARSKGIRINTIGCSGLDSGKSEFEHIAQATGGTYNALTYQTVVTDDSGVQRSVIYYGGETYEAEKVLDRKDWGRGGGALLGEGKLRRARPSVAKKAAAPGAETDNNIDIMVEEDVKQNAAEMGVKYR